MIGTKRLHLRVAAKGLQPKAENPFAVAEEIEGC